MPQDLIRLMHALFLPAAACGEAAWSPAADVYRTGSGWLIKFDLAGVRRADIELIAAGCNLTVRGTRRDLSAEAACRCYQMEIAYGPFERTLQLPCDLTQAAIACDFRDGVLVVTIGPREERL